VWIETNKQTNMQAYEMLKYKKGDSRCIGNDDVEDPEV